MSKSKHLWLSKVKYREKKKLVEKEMSPVYKHLP